jgi:predicted dehydrogenase
MKFLVVGLGSMGKRRVRNLISLGYQDKIAGFDIQGKRRVEAQKYDIDIYDNFEKALKEHKPNVMIISTPPNLHMEYAYKAVEHSISCFIEASVVDSKKILELDAIIENRQIVVVPSSTMRYFPAPKKIKELIQDDFIGKVLNFNYHTGQFLPDWHPWEDIEDFYVSNPHTGGAREIVPFELTWLNNIFGDSKPLACVRRKLTDMSANIDDIYHCLLEYPENVIGNLTVEVISRPKATRNFRVIGSEGEISFDGDTNTLKYINTTMQDWKIINFNQGTVEDGYINPEEPYINEMKEFIECVELAHNGKDTLCPNNLKDDHKILNILYELENLSEGRNDLSR